MLRASQKQIFRALDSDDSEDDSDTMFVGLGDVVQQNVTSGGGGTAVMVMGGNRSRPAMSVRETNIRSGGCLIVTDKVRLSGARVLEVMQSNTKQLDEAEYEAFEKAADMFRRIVVDGVLIEKKKIIDRGYQPRSNTSSH